MSNPEMVLLVRFQSELPLDKVLEIAESRADEFRALSGLTQKYYVHDAVTGEYGGLYLWASAQALSDYRESELRASIAAAYQTVGEPRIDVLKVVKTLRDNQVL
jgi:hypothetical protein